MNEQLEFLKEIARRLDSARIPYMLSGSMALNVYAPPRMTRDLDIVIELNADDVERFVKLFEHDCYVDENAVRRAALSHDMVNIIHNDWVVKADFVVRKNEPYRLEEFSRRRIFDIEGTRVSIVAPEDLILSKLVWSHSGTSELQLRDVRAIIENQPNLDWAYLSKWSGELGVAPLLQKLRTGS